MRSTKSAKIAFVAMAAALAVGNAGAAGVATGTLLVSALVVQTCVVAALPLTMGSYTSADLTVPGQITVTCTDGSAAYQVGLDSGTNSSSVTTRKLKFGTNTLNYALYSDVGLSNNWGNTVGTDTLSSSSVPGIALTKVFPVYGKILGGQSAAAGLYTDSVVVTVTY